MQLFFELVDSLSWPVFIILLTLCSIIYVLCCMALGKLLRRLAS